ncbi:MAG: SnoaL-like domain-containing protein [Ferruginibacter sp.]
MTVNEIATKLVKYCESEDYLTAQKELYSDDVISIEPEDSHGYDKETKGLKAVNEKIQKFVDSIETSYGSKASVPVIAGNSFSFKLDMDIKMKGQERNTMSELCVFTIKDEKIIKEEFFW